MPKKKTAPIREPEPTTARWFFGSLFNLFRRHGSTIAFWVGMGYIVRQISLVFIAYAGKESNANLVFNLMSNVNFVFTGSITQ